MSNYFNMKLYLTNYSNVINILYAVIHFCVVHISMHQYSHLTTYGLCPAIHRLSLTLNKKCIGYMESVDF